jgi:glucose-6-phosphate dehydrogenase assembly protein OpcA
VTFDTGAPIGGIVEAPRPQAGEPVLRWSSRTRTIAGVEAELSRIWSSIPLTTMSEYGEEERRIAARSSVMNLVVICGRGEVGERAAAIIQGLSGRHPSRSIVATPADPDGPSWLDAQIQAHCVLPSDTAPETCAELVYLTAGGEAGGHLAGLVAPLLIHDLPTLVWWPSEPRFESVQARGLLEMADRILVDSSGWSGDGLARLRTMARLPRAANVAISDFALIRQARWREAIASTFDRPDLRPYVRSIKSVTVRYAAHDMAPGLTNIVKPLYHAAWLASRLGWTIERPLAPVASSLGYEAMARDGRRHVAIAVRPVDTPAPPGTTLAVELIAHARGMDLRVDVTARAEGVTVRQLVNGASLPARDFLAARRNEADLLAETIESVGSERVAAETLAMAARLVAPPESEDGTLP